MLAAHARWSPKNAQPLGLSSSVGVQQRQTYILELHTSPNQAKNTAAARPDAQTRLMAMASLALLTWRSCWTGPKAMAEMTLRPR